MKMTYQYGISPSPLLELTPLNIETHFKTSSTTSPVRLTPATQTGHAQTQVAGLAISSTFNTDNNNTTLEEGSFKLPDYCTVHQTELTAIFEACKYLSTYTNTDSLSSIRAISLLSTRSRTTRDCYDTLNAFGSTDTIEIRWIAAHIGLWGNEKADELAKTGTTSEFQVPNFAILHQTPDRRQSHQTESENLVD